MCDIHDNNIYILQIEDKQDNPDNQDNKFAKYEFLIKQINNHIEGYSKFVNNKYFEQIIMKIKLTLEKN